MSLNSKVPILKILDMRLYSPWMKTCIQDGIIINGRTPKIIQLIDIIDSTLRTLEVARSMKSFSQVFKQSKMKMKLTLALQKLL